MLYIVNSRKKIEDVGKALEESARRNGFGVLAIHDLRQKMKEKGVEFNRPCLIYEVCNPRQAKEVLEENLEISTALPCRISAYEEGGVVKLATIKPTAMIAMYEAKGIKHVAEEVETVIKKIMDEAAA